MRPRHGGELTWPHPPGERRHTPSLPDTYKVKHRGQTGADRQGEQNKKMRKGEQGTSGNTRLPPLPRRQPPPINTTLLEEVMRNVITTASPHPTKSYPLVSSHIDTLITNRPCQPRRHETEMRPRSSRKINAWPHPLKGPGLTPPLPKKYTAGTWRYTEDNRPEWHTD
jgi:hypothetical protein